MCGLEIVGVHAGLQVWLNNMFSWVAPTILLASISFLWKRICQKSSFPAHNWYLAHVHKFCRYVISRGYSTGTCISSSARMSKLATWVLAVQYITSTLWTLGTPEFVTLSPGRPTPLSTLSLEESTLTYFHHILTSYGGVQSEWPIFWWEHINVKGLQDLLIGKFGRRITGKGHTSLCAHGNVPGDIAQH